MDATDRYLDLLTAVRYSIGRITAIEAHWSDPATDYQIRLLNRLVRQGLQDKSDETRRAVIQRLANLARLGSTKDLLKWEAGTLIQYLKEYGTDGKLSEQGQFLIRETESRLSQGAQSEPAQ